jgi:hypothetical protein
VGLFKPDKRDAPQAGAVVDDMRAVDPIGYITAVGLRPEDSFGFLPLDLSEGASFFFLYRDRPEYAQAKDGLPAAQAARGVNLGVVDLEFNDGGRQHDSLAAGGPMGTDPAGLADMASGVQQEWGPAAGSGVPPSIMDELQKAKDMGFIDEQQFGMAAAGLQSDATQDFRDEYERAQQKAESDRQKVLDDFQADMPAPLPVAASPANAPAIVAHRLYPEPQVHHTGRQLDHFLGPYCDALALCPEDVYGVFPRQIRSSTRSGDNNMVWDDYWIIYRDRDEYVQGRQAWTETMNAKLESGLMGKLAKRVSGNWPEAQTFPGVAEAAEPGRRPAKVEVEKDRWPREKVVMRKRGTELGDALREKIGGWSYRPEDSFGFCPDFDNGSIYFAWRKS